MNYFKRQFTEKQQKHFFIIVLVVFIAIASIGTLAWFYNKRQIYTYTEVQEPVTLDIKGPEQTYMVSLDIGNINLRDDVKRKYIVFCVTTMNNTPYRMELAYTTNIGLTYNLYHASRSTEGTNSLFTYITLTGQAIHYSITGNKMAGTTLNKDETINSTYAEGDIVQTDANPTYYLLNDEIVPGNYNSVGDNSYVNYYILELDWSNLTNADITKETDMVYVMAENVIT